MADTIRAFTSNANSIVRQLRSDVYVENSLLDQDSAVNVPNKAIAVWDTGAFSTCISENLAKRMGLISVGKVNQSGVGGSRQAERYIINLILPNKVRCMNVTVSSGEFTGFDILIGMDIISAGDFAITNFGGNTTFTFRLPSQGTIDFCKELDEAKKSAIIKQKHGPGKRKKKR